MNEITAHRQKVANKLAKWEYLGYTITDSIVDQHVFLEALFMENSKILHCFLKNSLNVPINSDYIVYFLDKTSTIILEIPRGVSGVLSCHIDKSVGGTNLTKFLEHMKKNERRRRYMLFGVEVRDYFPLEIAVLCSHVSAIETLLKFGAHPLIPSPFKDEGVLLEGIWSLPTSTIQNIVKYTVLQLDISSDEKLQSFFAYFRERNARAYFEFAQECIDEVKTLKSLDLVTGSSSLYDFVISQGEKLSSFLSDIKISDDIFNILCDTSLPVYTTVIFQKFKRKYFLDSLLKFQWYAINNHNVSLNSDCLENIYRYLHKEELGLFLLCLKAVK